MTTISRFTLILAGVAVLCYGGLSRAAETTSPNILWLIAEDLGVELGCYGNKLVHTPNLDNLAGEGARYTNAFTTAPVCSASRSGFMTGMYQTSIGAHNHRSHRRDGYRLPDGVHVITDYFRQAGYFTANVRTAAPGVRGTCKTDFNFNVEKPFDGTDWNQRRDGQPFFAQVNFSETHRRFKKARENPVDPQKVTLPPYYPDHAIAREDWALYLDTVGYLDAKVGAVLKRLEEEGLADTTIVFFFGDHGRAHVRGKQWLYDGGIHIPLIVRIPERFRPRGHGEPGTVCDDLISAIDIAASSLAWAGTKLPTKMEGRPTLFPGVDQREFIVAARDRCDETVDRIRCVRTKRYKYIRNFYPDRPYTQPNRYKERQYPVLGLLKQLHSKGKLTPVQELFMAARRPPEELYDLTTDPHEVSNLADSPRCQQVLKDLRAKLAGWIEQTGDQGRIPEDPSIIEFWQKRQKQKHGKKARRGRK